MSPRGGRPQELDGWLVSPRGSHRDGPETGGGVAASSGAGPSDFGPCCPGARWGRADSLLRVRGDGRAVGVNAWDSGGLPTQRREGLGVPEAWGGRANPGVGLPGAPQAGPSLNSRGRAGVAGRGAGNAAWVYCQEALMVSPGQQPRPLARPFSFLRHECTSAPKLRWCPCLSASEPPIRPVRRALPASVTGCGSDSCPDVVGACGGRQWVCCRGVGPPVPGPEATGRPRACRGSVRVCDRPAHSGAPRAAGHWLARPLL